MLTFILVWVGTSLISMPLTLALWNLTEWVIEGEETQLFKNEHVNDFGDAVVFFMTSPLWAALSLLCCPAIMVWERWLSKLKLPEVTLKERK